MRQHRRLRSRTLRRKRTHAPREREREREGGREGGRARRAEAARLRLVAPIVASPARQQRSCLMRDNLRLRTFPGTAEQQRKPCPS
ncbi:hypothetical protein K431DRAFT_66633 [Polychaeton citri CBS 116435]|uniref:Uncharacterized protein n=1 Tax=Polychaeton citri CBS 116435 TaxID=1314669 RepID=A0A9P4QB42_9PEZI|nr:hypothetical protein K431DRAFT_66633 [Polychaeton citri CBS 116435]